MKKYVLLFATLLLSNNVLALTCITETVAGYGDQWVNCPSTYAVVSASCNGTAVITDTYSPLPPGSNTWNYFLIPNATQATGVRCNTALNSTIYSMSAAVRCCK